MKKAILKIQSVTIKQWIVLVLTIAAIVFIHFATPIPHR